MSGTSASFSSTVTATGGVYVGSGTAGRNAFSQGDFRIAAPNDANILNCIAANASMTIKSDNYGGGSATPLILQSGANTNQLYLATTGNVGIGTSSPNKKLELNTANGVSDGLRITYNAVVSEGLDITYLNSGNTTISFDSIYNSNSAIMQFRMKTNGAPLTAMTILGSGNVGIGTVSPTYKFETLGTSVITAAFGRSDYGASNVMLIAMNGYRDVYKQAIGVVRTGDYDKGDMIFCLNGSANSTVVSASDERMRITSGGEVGIGVIPTSGNRFWVKGSSTSGGDTTILAQNSAGTNLFYVLNNGNVIMPNGNVLVGTADDGGRVVSYSTTAATQIKAAGTAPAITFSNTVLSPTIGGVLGACTAANQFLSGTASGDMVLANQFSGFRLYVASYSGGVYLTSGATSWTANSDIRLKNINSHIENAVEKLSTLQTINFSYKDDKFKKQNLGLIAQEVEKIFPELIDKNGDGMLGVRYTELVPVLIKAIQELKLEIETLKNK